MLSPDIPDEPFLNESANNTEDESVSDSIVVAGPKTPSGSTADSNMATPYTDNSHLSHIVSNVDTTPSTPMPSSSQTTTQGQSSVQRNK